MTFERLPWDSEFFGIGIGRADLSGYEPGAVTPDLLASIDSEARSEAVECIYASVDPADMGLSLQLQRAGYLLVEVGMDLRHPTSVIDVVPEVEAKVRVGAPDDVARLAPEIELLLPWSRYAVDPRFGPGAARRMYEAWAARGGGADPHRFLTVAEEDGEIVGFTTGSEIPGELPRIDLIASSRAGAGVARRMVDFVFQGFGEVPSMGGPIAARNIVSLRFVLGMGYRMHSARYLYHRWLTD